MSAEQPDDAHLVEVPVSSEAVFDGKLLQVRRDHVRLPDGTIATREYTVHPGAVVATRARLGEGTVVMALAAVNPDAEVGRGVILNTGCVVEHDCRVGPLAHLSPNVALGGGVEIGAGAHLGLGAVVLPLVKVGAQARVGAEALADGRGARSRRRIVRAGPRARGRLAGPVRREPASP